MSGRSAAPRRRRKEALAAEVHARVDAWLAAVAAARPDDYVDAQDLDDVPPAALADSRMWCDLVLSPDASPHNESARAHCRFHASRGEAPDLLRHETTAAGLQLVITEGRNFLLVEIARESVDILALPPSERAAAVRRVARRLFHARAGCRPRFRLPPALDEGAAFSSRPSADPRVLSDCARRVEGGIRNGALYFLWYKREPQRVGFVNAHQWFEDAYRRRGA